MRGISARRSTTVADGGKRSGASFLVTGAVAALIAVPTVRADDTGLEEVVVTANKRAEDIQKVPIAMVALSGDEIADAHITDIIGLGQLVPGVQLKDEFGVAQPLAFIRGVGNSSFYATSINPVGFYEDGVYIGQNIAQGLQIFDTDRVEVLRGPQGTLFGRNTTGGAIDVITHKPTLDGGTVADAQLVAGDYGTFDANASLGGSITPTLAYRFAFTRQFDHGVYENVNPQYVGPDRDVGDTNILAGRGEVLWAAADRVSVLFNVHGGWSHGQNIPNKPGFLAATPPTNCPPGALSGGFRNGCTDPSGFGLMDAPGFYQVVEAAPGNENITAGGASAELNWDFSGLTFTSISAWDTASMDRFHNSDGLPLAFIHSTFITDAQFWSEELRLTSRYSGPWNWVGGLYYYGDNNHSFTHYNDGDLFGGTGLASNIEQKTQSYAIFGDGTFKFSDRWTLTSGLRETWDKRSANIITWVTNSYGVITPPAVDPAIIPATSPLVEVTQSEAQAAFISPLIPLTAVEKTWAKWSGRLILSYTIDDARMAYASASHGFKGGEFNGGALFTIGEVDLTNPEYVDNFELGFKGTELGGKLQTNIDVYLSNYKDQQVLANIPGSINPYLENAARSKMSGVEVDVHFRPSKNWFLSLGGDYLDAHFTNFTEGGVGSEAGTEVNLSGNRLPEAPEWSYNVLVRYETPIGDGNLAVQADQSWNASRFFTPENTPALKTASYGLLNGRVSYQFLRAKAEFGIWGKNLLNKEYISSAYSLASFGLNVFQPGRPRVLGADFSYHFD